MKRRTIVTLGLLIIVVGVLVVGVMHYATLSSLREVTSYRQAICEDMSPECGVCPGQLIDSKCYVKRGTFEQYP